MTKGLQGIAYIMLARKQRIGVRV